MTTIKNANNALSFNRHVALVTRHLDAEIAAIAFELESVDYDTEGCLTDKDIVEKFLSDPKSAYFLDCSQEQFFEFYALDGWKDVEEMSHSVIQEYEKAKRQCNEWKVQRLTNAACVAELVYSFTQRIEPGELDGEA